MGELNRDSTHKYFIYWEKNALRVRTLGVTQVNRYNNYGPRSHLLVVYILHIMIEYNCV
jgi:hypothetical protein